MTRRAEPIWRRQVLNRPHFEPSIRVCGKCDPKDWNGQPVKPCGTVAWCTAKADAIGRKSVTARNQERKVREMEGKRRKLGKQTGANK